MTRVLFFLAMVAVAVAITAGPAQAQLAHRYSFTDLTDSVGDADGVALGDAGTFGGQLLLNLDAFDVGRNGRVDLLANGANGININTYSSTMVEFWAAPNCQATDGSCDPNPNNSFSTAVGFGKTYTAVPPPDIDPGFVAIGAGADYIIMQTHRGDEASRGAIAVTDEDVRDSPWEAETGVNGPEENDGNLHHYALVITGTTLSWYVDGVRQDASPAPGFQRSATLARPNAHGERNSLAGVSNQNAWIGSGYEIDQRWAGAMDELRIYNSAASADYVAASFAAGPNALANFDPIPEPASLGLGLLGLCGLGVLRRRARG